MFLIRVRGQLYKLSFFLDVHHDSKIYFAKKRLRQYRGELRGLVLSIIQAVVPQQNNGPKWTPKSGRCVAFAGSPSPPIVFCVFSLVHMNLKMYCRLDVLNESSAWSPVGWSNTLHASSTASRHRVMYLKLYLFQTSAHG